MAFYVLDLPLMTVINCFFLRFYLKMCLLFFYMFFLRIYLKLYAYFIVVEDVCA